MGGTRPIPIVDVFAGPGGLGEGFSSLADERGQRAFRLALSVEKEAVACQTLRLRAVRRQLAEAGELDTYYEFLRGGIDRAAFDELPLVRGAFREASEEVMNAELGKCPAATVDSRIRSALAGETDWVLIGGLMVQLHALERVCVTFA